MAEARKIGNNLYGKTSIDNILKVLLTNGKEITEYQYPGVDYKENDIVYIVSGPGLAIYRALKDNDGQLTGNNWTQIKIENFDFDNPPVISGTEPVDKHIKIWIQPVNR